MVDNIAVAAPAPQYWVVGAMWEGQDDQLDLFFRRGYWFLGHNDQDQPDQAKRRDSILFGDRIAIKKMLGQGSPAIEIRAIGIVHDIDTTDKRIYVNWILRDLNRIVPSRGCYKAIHGPYFASNDPDWGDWTNTVFRI